MWESDVMYTHGEIVYKRKRMVTHKGWREAEIKHFNTICKKVPADCKDNPAIVKRGLKVWWEQTRHVPKLK
jgi:hypothetical protein